MTMNENARPVILGGTEANAEFMPLVTISQLEYENLVRADEALKIVTELLQAEKDSYASVKHLKVILGITN